MSPWSNQNIPAQQGRLAVITGATGGLGFETALALAGAGAQVVLTGRNAAKGAAALARIRAAHPASVISYETLDLGSLTSIRDFADRFKRMHGALNLLVNNGGVMAPPTRQETADGFELQFGTNYLSHFALTAHLLPWLVRGNQPRVVNLSSVAHRFGASIHFDDLNWQHRYQAFAAYGQSKLAMLMFTFELQRRSDAHAWGLLSVAAHPGFAATALFANGPGKTEHPRPRWIQAASAWLTSWMAQSASVGALPILYAATSPAAEKAGYYGPTGLMESRGPVGDATVGPSAKDQVMASRLWDISETLTDLNFRRPGP
jgi:NAD(P)-dependent dehydrogenase (short-subunit alcohol dehydrogenase family)